jgi:low affinity Fe/Cu permease
MSSLYSAIERAFDRLTSVVTRVLGSSFTFILALCVVIYWITGEEFLRQSIHGIIRDSLLAITFLSFFIVQKSVNRYSAALHLKVNELVASHDKASNQVVNVETKTEEEIRSMAKKYEDLESKSGSNTE